MSGDDDFRVGFFAGCGASLACVLLFFIFWAGASDESDNTTQLEERVNVLELSHYDTCGSIRILTERVRKLEESEEQK